MRATWWFGIAAISLSAPAYAQSASVNAPAGRAGDSAIAVARQTGASIVITDRELADRAVPAIRGRYSASQAVTILARAARARAISTGNNSWRLVPNGAGRSFVQRRVRTPLPPVARADSSALPPEGQGEDIVVTASKRDAALSEFAGQVSMVDGEDLTFGGVGGTDKIIQRIPTVSSTYLGSGRNKLFIRGIADSSFTGPTQSTVGQYIGDLRLSYNAPDPDLRLSDLARVEVLEGPQGTLYGAGSLGGIVRLVPNEPVRELVAASGMIGGSATQHGAVGGDASLTANLPLLSDRAALRFTVNAESQGGYIDKPALGREDVNRTDILSGRVAARFEALEGWTVDLIGIAQHTESADSQYADRDGPPLSRATTVTEGHDASFRQGQLVVTGHLTDNLLFKSSTGVTGQNLEERYDATLPAQAPRLFVQQNDTAMVANETRVWQPLGESFGWLAGVSFTHNRTSLTRSLGAPDALNPVTGVTNVVHELTGFAEGTLRIADGVTATAGGRYTRTRLSGDGEDVTILPASSMAFREVITTRTEDVFLPSASLAASVLPQTTVFVRYQEGFRPGGLAIAGNFLNRFSNDHIATFELGARRGRSGRGPFDLAASVSYTRWSDIQADFIDSAGFPSTANIGDGRIWTLTASAGVKVSPNLRIDGGFTYNDSRIDQPSVILLQSAAVFLNVPTFSGGFADLPRAVLDRITQVPNVADLSGRIGFDYWQPIGRDLELTAQGWATYIGTSRLGIGPELGEEQGDYLDTGLTVRVGRAALGLTLGLTNLADEEGNRFALGTPFTVGRSQITPLRPRTIRIGVDAAF